MQSSPYFSIILPTYNTPLQWLKATIESVLNQTYPRWELCICDDASTQPETLAYLKGIDASHDNVKITFSEKNSGIALASHSATQLAIGDYLVLLDHDDLLTPNALAEVAYAIQTTHADLLYSDEDKITIKGALIEPAHKPQFSPETLLSCNYICHLLAFTRTLYDAVGGFRTGVDGAQDYDLVLRLSNQAEHIHHIPKVLYHWRVIPGSTADDMAEKPYAWEAGRKALDLCIQDRGYDATAVLGPIPGTYRLQWNLQSNPVNGQLPHVTIIIPFKDKPDLLEQCLSALTQQTTYPHWDVIGINNQSVLAETQQLMQRWTDADTRVRFIDYPHPFNYAAMNNHAVKECAKGDYVVLMNNDIEVMTPDWIECLLEYAQQDAIGAVGAKLLYPNKRVQHAGIVIGLNGVADHPFRGLRSSQGGYMSRACIPQNVSAVTAALLMVSREKYLAVNGLDSAHFANDYNDVDFCLRLRQSGFRSIYTPYCLAIHHESVTRGDRITKAANTLAAAEKMAFKQRHEPLFQHGDPYYNPNLSKTGQGYKPVDPSTRLLVKTKLGKHRRLLLYYQKPCKLFFELKGLRKPSVS